jgi:HAD superfamily hydrolase (TIGR01484 family)
MSQANRFFIEVNMKILATDLDRTLLPNGSWECDSQAISLFNDLTEKHDVLVVYVTGRNLALTENAINEFGVRHPDILCGDVGTSIRKYENGKWTFDHGWIDHVKKESPRWDAMAIREAVAGIDGMREQETEHLNQFKQSYYVEHERNDQVLKKVDEQVKGKFDEVIVYSFDSQDDSGNDIFPLTAGFCGVLVKNADDQLVENVKEAMNQNPELKVYFAKGGFKDLKGYYTSGVIEGAYHYGIFDHAIET